MDLDSSRRGGQSNEHAADVCKLDLPLGVQFNEMLILARNINNAAVVVISRLKGDELNHA